MKQGRSEFLGLSILAASLFPSLDRLGEDAETFRFREMIRARADLCVVVHRSLAATLGAKDRARQAIAAGIPTYLIDSEQAVPRWMREGDGWLEQCRALPVDMQFVEETGITLFGVIEQFVERHHLYEGVKVPIEKEVTL